MNGRHLIYCFHLILLLEITCLGYTIDFIEMSYRRLQNSRTQLVRSRRFERNITRTRPGNSRTYFIMQTLGSVIWHLHWQIGTMFSILAYHPNNSSNESNAQLQCRNLAYAEVWIQDQRNCHILKKKIIMVHTVNHWSGNPDARTKNCEKIIIKSC